MNENIGAQLAQMPDPWKRAPKPKDDYFESYEKANKLDAEHGWVIIDEQTFSSEEQRVYSAEEQAAQKTLANQLQRKRMREHGPIIDPETLPRKTKK